MALFKKAAPVAAPPAAPKSVASITASLADTLLELEAHAEEQAAFVTYQKAAAERALLAAGEHAAEAELATTVAGNIRALLGEA